MAKYRALGPLFIGHRYIEAGEAFDSDLSPGRNWEPIDEDARRAKGAAPVAPEPKLPGEHRTAKVEIPDGWRDLKGLPLINIAKKLGMPRGKGREDAIALIERELAMRSMSAAA